MKVALSASCTYHRRIHEAQKPLELINVASLQARGTSQVTAI